MRPVAKPSWWRWVAAMALLLCAATPSLAHDIPNELRVHAFVRPEGEHLRVLVRVPLDLLLNINLPKRPNGYLELSEVDKAFPGPLRRSQKTSSSLKRASG